MMRKRVTDTQLRELVRARRTKGSAFLSDKLRGCSYENEQQQVTEELATMTREEILEKWPEYTYDIA